MIIKCKYCHGGTEVNAGETTFECDWCGHEQAVPETEELLTKTASVPAGDWFCGTCGSKNTGNFCSTCGSLKPTS